jgi:hypothetical protein
MGLPEHRSSLPRTELPPDDHGDDDHDHDAHDGDDAYERAQPDSQPPVSSEPEPDDDPANAG